MSKLSSEGEEAARGLFLLGFTAGFLHQLQKSNDLLDLLPADGGTILARMLSMFIASPEKLAEHVETIYDQYFQEVMKGLADKSVVPEDGEIH